MLKRPRIIALTLVLLLALAVMNLPSRWIARFELAAGGFFLPLFGLASSSQSLANKAGEMVVPRRTLARENEELRRENQALKIQFLRAQEIQKENDRLRDQVSAARQFPWKLKLARVIGRDPANWWRAIYIDLGTRDGLATNQVVMTPQGLVGRISQAGVTRSQVVLVGDPNCGVAAMVAETRDTTGLIAPPSIDTFNNTMVDLTKLSSTANLEPGQKVSTSGQGGTQGVFPKGIPIGRIVDWRVLEFGLYAEARVKLAVDFNQLEEVWVIMP